MNTAIEKLANTLNTIGCAFCSQEECLELEKLFRLKREPQSSGRVHVIKLGHI